ncbi:MAG: class I SAM-dependent methyltransferase [Armatimonadota bacterium]
MRSEELERMYRLEETYWWFGARRLLVRYMLDKYRVAPGSLLMDAGCGTGGTFLALRDRWSLVGVDISPVALEFAKGRGMTLLVGADVQRLPFGQDVFDGVVACDVLEHLEDDVAALAELRRVTKANGVLVVTVPALPWLWSDHDEALGHLRRYTRRGLRSVLIEAGWKVERLNYSVTLLMPAIAGFRLFRRARRRSGAPKVDLFEMPGPVNAVLGAVCRLDSWLAARVAMLPGASLLAVGKKIG